MVSAVDAAWASVTRVFADGASSESLDSDVQVLQANGLQVGRCRVPETVRVV